ncbi:MAG: extracellular solute-binding protein [Clostridia bacterium]|nr:extracellular solute-binding protein [Clostridia bacterium]
MKRFSALCVVLCFLFFIPFALAENNGNQTAIVLGVSESIGVLCRDNSSDGSCYLLSSEALYHWDAATQSAKKIVDVLDNRIAGIVSYNGNLYGIDHQQNILQLQDQHWVTLKNNDISNDEIFRCKADCGNGYLFYSYKDENSTVHLIAYNFETQAFTVLSPFDSRQFCYDSTHDCLVSVAYLEYQEGDETKEGYFIQSYHYQTNTYDENVLIHGLNGGLTSWTYDAEHDRFFFSLSSKTLSYIRGGYAEDFTPYTSGITAYIGNDTLAMIGGHEAFELQLCRAETTDRQITIMDYSTVYQPDFTKETGIGVNLYTSSQDSTTAAITQIMTTQDTTVDIIGLHTDEGLSVIKQKGFYTPLTSENLLNAFNELYTTVASPLLDDNGAIIAWPVFAMPILMTSETALLEEYGFSTPTSFEEFLDLVPQIVASDLMQEQDCVLLSVLAYNRHDMFQYLVEQYVLSCYVQGKDVNFTDETFTRLAARVLTEVPEKDPSPSNEDGTCTPLFNFYSASNIISEELTAPLPLTNDGTTGIYTRLIVLIVNPYSEHKAEAIAFLEYMANKRTPEDYALYASMTEPLLDSNVVQQIESLQEQAQALNGETDAEQLASIQADIAVLEAIKYTVSPAAIENYRTLAASFVIPEESLPISTVRFTSLVERTSSGMMSLDQFIEQANQYVQMITLEGA